MISLLNFLVIGVALGAIYGLLATSMGLIWQTTKVLDLAVGAYAAVGGMVCAAIGLPWGVPAGILAAAAVSAITGLVYLGLQRRGVSDQISAAFASIGVLFAGTSFVLWYFGTEPKFIELLRGMWTVQGVSFSKQGMVNIVLAFLIVGVVLWIIYRTPLGEVLRATAISRQSAELIGIPVRSIQFSMFAAGGALAGLAGVLMVFTRGMSYGLGLTLTIAAFGAMIVFGLRGLLSALIGGLVLGVVEAIGAGYFPSSVASMVPLVFILVVLVTGRFKLEGVRP